VPPGALTANIGAETRQSDAAIKTVRILFFMGESPLRRETRLQSLLRVRTFGIALFISKAMFICYPLGYLGRPYGPTSSTVGHSSMRKGLNR
jgi:hypothetical protein